MKKTVLIYGLLASVLCSGLMLFMPREMNEESIGSGMLLGYTCFFLSAVLICFGIASYKKNVLGGTISYGKAVAVGLLTCLVASTVYVGVWMTLYKPVFSEFGKSYGAIMAKQMKEKGESDKKIQEMFADMERYDNDPVYRASLTYLEPLSMQVPIVLIGSIFIAMRKRRKQPEFDFNKK